MNRVPKSCRVFHAGRRCPSGSDTGTIPPCDQQGLRPSPSYSAYSWFDIHVHVYSNLAFSDSDTVGVLHGVTTMTDAGGSGVWTYDDYRNYWEGQCKTEVYA